MASEAVEIYCSTHEFPTGLMNWVAITAGIVYTMKDDVWQQAHREFGKPGIMKCLK